MGVYIVDICQKLMNCHNINSLGIANWSREDYLWWPKYGFQTIYNNINDLLDHLSTDINGPGKTYLILV